MSEKKLERLLTNLFAVKGIAFEGFEIYIWNIETNRSERVEKFGTFEELGDFDVIFCLSNVQVSVNDVPFNFERFDFSCSCVNGKCCNLYLDPDVFSFDSGEDDDIKLITKMRDDMMERLSKVAQALFSLRSS